MVGRALIAWVATATYLCLTGLWCTYVRSVCAGVELKNVKMSMNPFCENAMEEAVKLKVSKDNSN